MGNPNYNRYFQRMRTTTNTTGSQACIEIIGPSLPNKITFIKKLDINLATAVASVFQVGRPTAAGVTPTSPVQLFSLDGGDDSLATWALAWGTSPTIPNENFNRFSLPATVGTRYEIEYPDQGLALRQNETFIIYNVGTVGVLDVAVTISEF